VSGHRAILIGDPEELMAFDRHFLLRHFGVQEVGRVVLRRDYVKGQADLSSIEAAIGRARDLARQLNAVEFSLALRWSDTRRLELVHNQLRVSPLAVRLLPDRAFGSILRQTSAGIAGAPCFELQRPPLSSAERFVKRVMDIILSFFGLIALSPLLVIVAAAVKFDSPGPVLFRQRRNGFDGRPFVIYKFRTMSVQEDGNHIRQATRNDPRVTRVGGTLRRTSIDELPQLFNVLKGDMSLVGPRPHAIAHDNEYSRQIGNYAFRHHMKPGITGWAQVNGQRGETARIEQMEKRVQLDIWYINNWTPLLDIVILFRTCFDVVRRKAY
jgi:undecaprenyl-phosphate galactose phosphotransferase/putative colanic acid biosynthesis UDP-glucose lipid carrier transferase